METSVQSIHSNTAKNTLESVKTIQPQLQLQPLEPRRGKSDRQYLKELRSRMSNLLQTTLDVEKVVSIFFEELRGAVELTGIRYKHPKENLHLMVGRSGKHSCNYELQAAGSNHGSLCFQRNRRWSDSELQEIESLMDIFIYPLRNALAYKSAIDSALTDALTGAGNRTAMNTALAREVELANRYRQDLSLVMLDVDLFKKVNDVYGHSTGDKVLQRVGDSIKYCIRGSDMSFRYGGEEFVVVLGKTNHSHALQIAERIRTHIAKNAATDNLAGPVTVSLGVSSWNAGCTGNELIDIADAALYKAKDSGRNRVVSGHRFQN
jgi:diguanylate cyclase (GGDEF)-like protein